VVHLECGEGRGGWTTSRERSTIGLAYWKLLSGWIDFAKNIWFRWERGEILFGRLFGAGTSR
jgi:hypothetical protein